MRVIITGGSGLVGKAIQEVSKRYEEDTEFIFLSSRDCNLLEFEEIDQVLSREKPDAIIHLAAQVGGLFKNMMNKVAMFEDNMIMNMNLLRAAHKNNIQRVISILSTCIFPHLIPEYPIRESMLHDGPPHHSNDGYAYAKRMLEVQSKAYQENYDRDYICLIPTNIYGPHDNYDLQNAHVIPALIHQCYLSMQEEREFMVKGSGKPLRQFIYSHDLAELILWALFHYNSRENLILSVDERDELSIEYIARRIAREMGYEDKIIFDTSYSDGQYKKTVSNELLRSHLPQYRFTPFEEGIHHSVQWFLQNYPHLRK